MKKKQNNSFSPPENCVECRKKYYKFSSILWDEKFKNIADIKWKDSGIVVITKILNVLNGFRTQIEFILDKISTLETPTEEDVRIINEYKGEPETQKDFNIYLNDNALFKPEAYKEEDFTFVVIDDLGNTYKVDGESISGKVKSVNGKEGDVILKISDLENDLGYIDESHSNNKNNPHEVTKAQIGLGNVNNTSDLNKPISTATQIELNKKLNKPTTNNTSDYVILADGTTELKTNFGKVKTVNGNEPDEDGNIEVDLDYIPLTGTEEGKPASGAIKTVGVWSIEGEGATSGMSVMESGLERYVVEDAQQALGEAGSLREFFYPLEYRLIHETGTVFNSIVSDYDGFYLNSSDPNSTSEGSGTVYSSSTQAGVRYVSKDNKGVYSEYLLEATSTGLEARKGAATFIASNDADIITKYNLQNFNYPTNWGSSSHKFPSLPNKSADTTYDRFIVQDSTGDIAYADNIFQAFKANLTKMTQAQTLELGQLLNGGQGSSGAISVNLISPPIIQNRFDSVEYVLLRGANLKLNELDMSISICDINKNVIQQIPNNQIINNSATELIFYYNFYQFAEGTYFIKITSGVKVYYTTLDLKIVNQVDDISFNNITWDSLYESSITPSGNDVLSENNVFLSLNSQGVTSTSKSVSVKSSEIFAEGDNFYLELQFNYTMTPINPTDVNRLNIGLGYSNSNNELIDNTLIRVTHHKHYNQGGFMSNNNLQEISTPSPIVATVIIVKTGNIFRTILSTGNSVTTTTKTISNNSGYSIFINDTFRAYARSISLQIVKAFKFN